MLLQLEVIENNSIILTVTCTSTDGCTASQVCINPGTSTAECGVYIYVLHLFNMFIVIRIFYLLKIQFICTVVCIYFT